MVFTRKSKLNNGHPKSSVLAKNAKKVLLEKEKLKSKIQKNKTVKMAESKQGEEDVEDQIKSIDEERKVTGASKKGKEDEEDQMKSIDEKSKVTGASKKGKKITQGKKLEEKFSDAEESENDDISDGESKAANKVIPSSDFDIDQDSLMLFKEKAADEINRIKKEIAQQKGKDPKSVPKCKQVYTIKKFVYEVMEGGFSEKYLRDTRMTAQKATRGEDIRTQMKPRDLHYIIKLTKTVWEELPGATLPKIESLTREAIRLKFNSKRKKNQTEIK